MGRKTATLLGSIGLFATITGISVMHGSSQNSIRVQQGDTFSSIYETHCDDMSYSAFKELNSHISEENGSFSNLEVGDTIYIEKDAEGESADACRWAGSVDDDISDILCDASTLTSLPRGMRAIALSNIAEGLYKRLDDEGEKAGTLDRVIDLMLSPEVNPYEGDLLSGELKGEGLYLSHLNIALGLRELVHDDERYDSLHSRISHHLAEATLQSPTRTIASYGGTPQRWPADQTATLYSLHLYDKKHGTDISELPVEEWLAYMQEHGSTPEGLHHSELTTKEGEVPRGCALSWSVYYMSAFAPEQAEKLWDTYTEHFLSNYGVMSGLREWPRGHEGEADIDSGPIINGIGASATVFGIRAAEAVDDNLAAFKLGTLYNTGHIGVSLFGSETQKELVDGALARSIDYNLEEGPVR